MTEMSERLRVALADRYQVERELGSGGMAIVYLARDIRHDRDVAGVIYLDSRLSGPGFTPTTLRMLGLIANMAAVKIENARLLEAQLEARSVEEQLTVASRMPGYGVIFSDGIEDDYVAFNSGSTVTVSLASKKAHLVTA